PSVLAAATVRAIEPGARETAASTVVALARDVLGPRLPVKARGVTAVLLGAVALAGGLALLPQTPANPEPTAAAAQPAVDRLAPRTDRFGDPLPDGAVARLGTVRFNHG